MSRVRPAERSFLQLLTLVIAASALTVLSACAPGNEIRDVGGDSSEIKSLSKDIRPISKPSFDSYVLKAVAELYDKYRLLGYDMKALYTHELPYGPFGFLKGTPGPKTMCVAAQLEMILTAIDIYARETGRSEVYYHLPLRSWKSLTINDIKGHIWVNTKFDSHGTADALVNFGMGELATFEELRPGAFINFNRDRGTGHAVTFVAFIDKYGVEYRTHNPKVIGFKYFSAQGLHEPGGGGLDYRYGVFTKYGCPETLPYKRDCGIMYSKKRHVFNAGHMWAPSEWIRKPPRALHGRHDLGESTFDSHRFDGITTDD